MPTFYLLSNANQEHEKFEDRKIAVLNRDLYGASTTNFGTMPKLSAEAVTSSRSDPLTRNDPLGPLEERLKKIEEDAAASKTLSLVTAAVAVTAMYAMTLMKK